MGEASNQLGGPPHPALSPRPAGGEGKNSVVVPAGGCRFRPCRDARRGYSRRRFPRGGSPDQMTQASIDVVGIGNAIVDVIAHSEEEFLAREGLVKGTMTLIDCAGVFEIRRSENCVSLPQAGGQRLCCHANKMHKLLESPRPHLRLVAKLPWTARMQSEWTLVIHG